MLLHLTITPRREAAALTDWMEQKYKLRVALADGTAAAQSSLNGVSASPFTAAQRSKLYRFGYDRNVTCEPIRPEWKGARDEVRLQNVWPCSVTSAPWSQIRISRPRRARQGGPLCQRTQVEHGALSEKGHHQRKLPASRPTCRLGSAFGRIFTCQTTSRRHHKAFRRTSN
jgi:hypothetical protein